MRGGIAYASNQRVTPQGRRVCDLVYLDGTTIIGATIASDMATPLYIPRADETGTGTVANPPRVLTVWSPNDPKPTVVKGVDSPDVLYAPGDFEREGGTGGREDGDDIDDDLTHTYMEEARIPGPNGTIALRQDGTTVVKCTSLSVQLPSGGFVRFSEDGDSDGRTLVSAPTADKLQHMVDTINELRDAVLSLQEALLSVAVVPVVNSTLTVQVASAPVPVTGVLRILEAPVYQGLAEPDVDSPALTSPIIRMSTRTEADAS